jgi:nitroimidazol reductase NimA-like FMN-containing flavoprotein (pyridoxamine 5'-phosphate oxidase superfamily)
MSDLEAIEMDGDERDDFLGAGGTGVIALSSADEESPHAVPVSYGYDGTEDVFYFRLSTGPDSEKGPLADRPVTFVTYGAADDDWRSVVAKGRLRSTTAESIAIESLEGLENVQIPLVEIFGRPTAEITFEFYRLDPEELTGRKEASTAP